MSNLPDAERDAVEVVHALAGLAALLQGDRWPDGDGEDTRRLLLNLAANGGESAARVLTYLREIRGPGDGAATAVPPRLGPWRDWRPSRGYLLGAGVRRPDLRDVRQPRRTDPGE